MILQTEDIKDVLQYVDSNTWVFFDIDDTLMVSSHQLGRSDYFFWEAAELKKQGIDELTAYQISRLRWNARQAKCPFSPMDPATTDVVGQIQGQAAYVMGLTARGPAVSAITYSQLKLIGVDFSTNSPESIVVDLPIGNSYEYGIWFVGPNEKGAAVRKWLEEISECPAKIVFVDDRFCYLETMEAGLSELGIEYIGIHYSKILQMPFDPQIATVQAESFPDIVTDEEALEKLRSLQLSL